MESNILMRSVRCQIALQEISSASSCLRPDKIHIVAKVEAISAVRKNAKRESQVSSSS